MGKKVKIEIECPGCNSILQIEDTVDGRLEGKIKELEKVKVLEVEVAQKNDDYILKREILDCVIALKNMLADIGGSSVLRDLATFASEEFVETMKKVGIGDDAIEFVKDRIFPKPEMSFFEMQELEYFRLTR